MDEELRRRLGLIEAAIQKLADVEIARDAYKNALDDLGKILVAERELRFNLEKAMDKLLSEKQESERQLANAKERWSYWEAHARRMFKERALGDDSED